MQYIKLSLIFFCLLMFTACFLMIPAEEPITYRLTSQPLNIKMGSPLKGTLLVEKLSGRGFVRSRNIVFWNSEKPKETQQYNYHLWVEPPPLLVRDILAETLRRARVSDYVITSNPKQREYHVGTIESDYKLNVETCKYHNIRIVHWDCVVHRDQLSEEARKHLKNRPAVFLVYPNIAEEIIKYCYKH